MLRIKVGKRVWFPKKTFRLLFPLIQAGLFFWLSMSWMEIILKTTEANPIYSAWNFWVLALGR